MLSYPYFCFIFHIWCELYAKNDFQIYLNWTIVIEIYTEYVVDLESTWNYSRYYFLQSVWKKMER